MNRTISSGTTFFLKFIFSGIFLSCSLWLIGYWIVELVRAPFDLPLALVVFTIMWATATTLFCYHLTIPLKKVSLDESNLYVSNYFHQIAIPLSEVEDIRQLRGFNVQPVIVRLRSRCLFGDKIKFVPQPELHWWWNEHPIVSELQRMVSVQEKNGALSTAQANKRLQRTRQ